MSFEGVVAGLFICDSASGDMCRVSAVRAVAGQGLEGDRYLLGTGSFWKPQPDRHVTLIEAEALEALARDYNIDLPPEATRRNVLTRDVPLNHLVGRVFRVGVSQFRGIRLCEPCSHLEKLTGRRVSAGLRHRGGLRCEIIESGVLQVGDRVHLV